MSIKSQLLTPIKQTPISITILGGEYNVTRLTAARLNSYDKDIKKHQADNNGEKLNEASAALVLDSIIDEDGLPMSSSVSTSDLMCVHTPTAINAAVTRLIQLNFMGEGAEAEAKNA
ncbi:hypothetical protein [Photobacterium leiognathi]|uniref:hypothetical protein n=1 Tax=Photobacterium leiognathi TaxID=553611 RepID=UPI000D15D007|nr:hypothetical protein [Photobacterium leiognathi]PSW53018.1 hypothetical protein C0W50_19615 [Photobacterium leiognathi subsp. mandapamensis]